MANNLGHQKSKRFQLPQHWMFCDSKFSWSSFCCSNKPKRLLTLSFENRNRNRHLFQPRCPHPKLSHVKTRLQPLGWAKMHVWSPEPSGLSEQWLATLTSAPVIWPKMLLILRWNIFWQMKKPTFQIRGTMSNFLLAGAVASNKWVLVNKSQFMILLSPKSVSQMCSIPDRVHAVLFFTKLSISGYFCVLMCLLSMSMF